ncbi:MAG: 4-hydroxy-3-methylbut-2-enyl diphosphate reductase [bacterium]|nr:4-hydroxy-3-methylbut-2-enyl diphosphate reductase [bacterium]
MRIFLIPNYGFCFGVKRSIDIAYHTIKNNKTPAYTWGHIIHNPQVVAQLEKTGVSALDSLKGIEPGKLIIRSHGVSPEFIPKAQKMGFEIIDATCPFVQKAQEYAKRLCNEGYNVVVIGAAEHPEVQGIIGHTNFRATVINDMKAISKLPRTQKLGIVSQTTLSPEIFAEMVGKLLSKAEEVRVYNTICRAVISRQQETLELAKKVKLMIIVGGKNSANTKTLAELARSQGCEAYQIETKDEIKKQWFKNKLSVGVTAGTSTPDWIILEVVQAIKNLSLSKKKTRK